MEQVSTFLISSLIRDITRYTLVFGLKTYEPLIVGGQKCNIHKLESFSVDTPARLVLLYS